MFWQDKKNTVFLPTKKTTSFLGAKPRGFFLLKKIGFFDFFQVFQGLLPIGLAFSAGLRIPTSQGFFSIFCKRWPPQWEPILWWLDVLDLLRCRKKVLKNLWLTWLFSASAWQLNQFFKGTLVHSTFSERWWQLNQFFKGTLVHSTFSVRWWYDNDMP